MDFWRVIEPWVADIPTQQTLFDPLCHVVTRSFLSWDGLVSAPFPYLSHECLRLLMEIIEHAPLQSSERIPHFLRGLGYRSTLVRDLCVNPTMLELLSKSTGKTIQPHYLFSNVGHVNLGLPNNRDVDQWHVDSVPYVLIILLSDPSEFEGGQLEYQAPDGMIHPVRFRRAGDAVFMKGSVLRHHVTPVTSGKRISLVFSYIDKNEADTTRLETFHQDEHHVDEVRSMRRWIHQHSDPAPCFSKLFLDQDL